jgi:hypothetical protein
MPMQPIDGRGFWQYWLIRVVREDPEGVCFRESFKWLASRMYGRPFKRGTLDRRDFDALNVKQRAQFIATRLPLDEPRRNPVSVLEKQRGYLGRVHPYEGPGKSFDGFSTAVNQISLETLGLWGKKQADGGGMKYNLSFADRKVDRLVGEAAFRNPEAALIIGVYGMSGKGGPWAHAVAFHHDTFFDSNGGEYGFDRQDDRGAEIQDHCERRYTGEDGDDTYDIRHYVLYHATRQ